MEKNNKENLIKEILEELYVSDISLKAKEEDLRTAIDKILSLRPTPVIDEGFRKRLRTEIAERILEMQKEESISSKFELADIFSFPQLSYALVGSLITLLVVIPSFYYMNLRGSLGQETGITARPNISLTQTDKRAFGDIGAEEGTLTQAEGVGGGGEGAPSYSQSQSISAVPSNYTYIYKGEQLTLDGKEVNVLEKEKGWKAGSDLIGSLTDMNFSLLDLSGFQNGQLNMFSFSEDKNFGYSIYIDLKNSSISIDKNYEKWPQPILPECTGKECIIRAEDAARIDESEALSIAANFMKEHRVNLEAYAEPEILKRNVFGSTGEPGYVTENDQIVYPLMVNGFEVYDPVGNKMGIVVNVDVREKRVAGVYNITSHRYLSSAYPAETDFSKITDRMGQGTYVLPTREAAGESAEITVGTPERVYVKEWRPTASGAKEMLIPALSFPIIEISEGITYPQDRIIVSLLAE